MDKPSSGLIMEGGRGKKNNDRNPNCIAVWRSGGTRRIGRAQRVGEECDWSNPSTFAVPTLDFPLVLRRGNLVLPIPFVLSSMRACDRLGDLLGYFAGESSRLRASPSSSLDSFIPRGICSNSKYSNLGPRFPDGSESTVDTNAADGFGGRFGCNGAMRPRFDRAGAPKAGLERRAFEHAGSFQ
jgi:hypothetical protein